MASSDFWLSDFMGRSALFIMSFMLILAIGTILGFLSGLGVGGGSLLMLWLTMVIGLDQSAARCINLLFFFPAALISSSFQLRQGAFDISDTLPAAIAGAVSAALCSVLLKGADLTFLRKCFGILWIFTGLYELRRSFRKEK